MSSPVHEETTLGHPLLWPSARWRPERLTDITDWHGHIPFAFWLIEVMRPRLVVELGAYKGDSYCSLCQALSAYAPNAVAYAVDTWAGDEHVGHYEESVFQELNTYNDVHYGGFSTLLRMTFSEASTLFADGTIDLLHIDGSHGYDSVREDFDAWLPKMSSRGVVLLHDIGVHKSGFGVWRLWAELAARYPHFNFTHDSGLGVLVVGDSVDPVVRQFAELSEADAETVRTAFSLLGRVVTLEGRLARVTSLCASAREQLAQVEQRASTLEQRIQGQDQEFSALMEQMQVEQASAVRLQELVAALRAQIALGTADARATAFAISAFEREQGWGIGPGRNDDQPLSAFVEEFLEQLQRWIGGSSADVQRHIHRSGELATRGRALLRQISRWRQDARQNQVILQDLQRALEVKSREVAERDAQLEDLRASLSDWQHRADDALRAGADSHQRWEDLSAREREQDRLLAHRIAALAGAAMEQAREFERSRTWRTARRLQGLKRAPTGNPLEEVFRATKSITKTIAEDATGPRAIQRASDVRVLAGLVQDGTRALVHSPTVAVARSLSTLAWLLRGRRPGPGALEELNALARELLFASQSLAAVDTATRQVSRVVTEHTTEVPADDRYRQHYETVLRARVETERADDYHAFRQLPKCTAPVRVIAWYLPQFHPIPENDEFWEPSFTEWTNVTRGLPQFLGHYQPQLPVDLGFYDLRVPDVMKHQIDIATNYGITAFCFHHYWFAGREVMRTPIDMLLSHPEWEIQYCINWANENWTRTWDGLDKEVLLQQDHSPEDDLAFIQNTMKYLRDPRYLRIAGMPVIMVYRPLLLRDPKTTAAVWREYCRRTGLGEIYLVAGHGFDSADPRDLGFDAAVEYAPNNMPLPDVRESFSLLNTGFTGKISLYRDAVSMAAQPVVPDYRKFRSVCPAWDNDARRPGRGTILTGSTPDLYQAWLDEACQWTGNVHSGEERLVFVNAWNEWAEGAHLEPDRRFGYAYLARTREVLDALALTEDIGGEVRKEARIAVVCHLYYAELWFEIADYIRNIPEAFDLFVTIPVGAPAGCRAILALKEAFPNAHVYRVENRGRDVWPFIQLLRANILQEYELILKLHSKRSIHRQDGEQMRHELLAGLAGGRERIEAILRRFADSPQVGLIGVDGFVAPVREHWGSNVAGVKKLAARLGAVDISCSSFVVGTMFWARGKALEAVLRLGLEREDFPSEKGQLDGEMQHAVERVLGLAVENAGYEVDSC